MGGGCLLLFINMSLKCEHESDGVGTWRSWMIVPLSKQQGWYIKHRRQCHIVEFTSLPSFVCMCAYMNQVFVFVV